MPDTAQLNPRDRNVEALFDVLTDGEATGDPCTSHEDIATRCGWPRWKVAATLWHIRRPEISTEWGWTVPHVPRGVGEHRFRVVLLDDPQSITRDELIDYSYGAISTLAKIATEATNEAHAVEAIAGHVPSARRMLRRIAKAFDGAAAMAEDARERMLDTLDNGGI